MLLQHVEMDIINIRLSSRSETSFWNPIPVALDEFKENLAEGIASAITAVAYLILLTGIYALCPTANYCMNT